MKKLVSLAFMFIVACTSMKAQEMVVPEGYRLVDSIVVRQTAVYDSAYVGKSIFDVLPEDVSVRQSAEIADAFRMRVIRNSERSISGYRVRIFFDNKQTSRNDSEEMLKEFRNKYPGVPAYRSFANPFFKVTVGDCRTASEASQLLEMVKGDFPSAFILKEKINYPVLDKEHSYVLDTIQVLVPIAGEQELIEL